MKRIIKLNIRLLVEHDEEFNEESFVENLDYWFETNENNVSIDSTEIIETLSSEEV
jgi:hypothetical protein